MRFLRVPAVALGVLAGAGALTGAGGAVASAANTGTALPEGLRVPAGAVRVAAALAVPPAARPRAEGTLTVLRVVGAPEAVWRALTRQLAARFPDERIPTGGGPAGCATDAQTGFGCAIDVDVVVRPTGAPAQRLTVSATLGHPVDDVGGRYLVTLRTARTAAAGTTDVSAPGSVRAAPVAFPAGAVRARPAPAVGRPLAPVGGGPRYVRLAGSRLLAVFGPGGATGGFDALLRVTPGGHVVRLAAAYARQARQGTGATRITRVRRGTTTVTRFTPPGAAGGLASEVTAYDGPGADDYLVYTLVND